MLVIRKNPTTAVITKPASREVAIILIKGYEPACYILRNSNYYGVRTAGRLRIKIRPIYCFAVAKIGAEDIFG